MTTNSQWKIIQSDLKILRDLARRVLDISYKPINEERRRLWYKHNSLQRTRPLVLAESGLAINEMVTDESFLCQ